MPRPLLVLLFTLLVPKLALACECITLQGPLIKPGSNGIVATAQVVDVRPPDYDGTGLIAAELEITEGFLNATAGTHLKVYTKWSEAACGYPSLQNGQELLVFTDYVEANDLTWPRLPVPNHVIGLCGTKVLDSPEGQKSLAEIREEMKQRRPR